MAKRDFIPVCSVHDRFQTQNGRWLDKGEDFREHVIFTCSQDYSEIESPCDECEDPKQIHIDFEEIKDYSGMRGNGSST